MIRILYLIDSLNRGGTEKQLVELMNGLDQERFEVHLCTLKPSKGLYEALDRPKFCLQFDSLLRPSAAAVVQRLVSYIRKNRIDIVQCFFQDPFALAALSKAFCRVKLIGSFRDLGFWRTAKESFKMRLAERAFDGFLANSQAVKEHFSEKDGIAPERINVIYNGFDLNRLPGLEMESRNLRSPIVGIVSNLNRPVKRVEDFVAAAAKVRDQVPGARFIVVGDGYLREQLEQQAAALGVGEDIRFVGSQPDPLRFVKEFSVGVITSETEGFSNAIIEYMACGVPVVATAAGGNIELIAEGENGFLVPVGAVETLAQNIVQLLDPDLNTAIAERNCEAVRVRYCLPAMIQQYEAFYGDLI